MPTPPNGRHLWTSLMMDITYGKRPTSDISGMRSDGTSRSISACAFFCTSGCKTIARTKLASTVAEVSEPPLIVTPARLEISWKVKAFFSFWSRIRSTMLLTEPIRCLLRCTTSCNPSYKSRIESCTTRARDFQLPRNRSGTQFRAGIMSTGGVAPILLTAVQSRNSCSNCNIYGLLMSGDRIP